jgi:hypothetical protein
VPASAAPMVGRALHITIAILLVKMLSTSFHPRRIMLENYFKSDHTYGDSVPSQSAGTWTISPRRFMQRDTAYGLRQA